MNWRTAHVSERGTSHEREGTPCQDYHIIDEAEGILLIALADGAGSASFSDVGARHACSGAIRHLKSQLSHMHARQSARQAIAECFQVALRDVEEEARKSGILPRDLATTLLVAVVGSQFFTFGQIGDGAILYDAAGELRLAHWADQEMLNVTEFLTATSIESSLAIGEVERRVNWVLLMSDGLTSLFIEFRTRSPHAPIVEKILNACSTAPDPASLNDDLRMFLRSDAVNERSDDDKTLIVALREM